MPEDRSTSGGPSTPPGSAGTAELYVRAAVIGGGPAGLMAAERIAQAGVPVTVFEAKPSLGRKFLRAGIGGLNLTHGEDYSVFCTRFGDRQQVLRPALDAFGPDEVRRWAANLGVETFEGTSGRVFPVDMKAAPLLRAWVHRLRAMGVQFCVRHRFCGWNGDGSLRFETSGGALAVRAGATVLALGGGSWPQLGSDAAWVPWLQARGVEIAPLRSANCGFDVAWSAHLRERHAGAQVKAVALTFTGADGRAETRRGEFVITGYGVEGGVIYACSRRLREAVEAQGRATFFVDLLPGRSPEHVLSEVLRPGGVLFEALDARYMVRALPGVFAVGEMLDWEAPTGGYLLTACLAQGAWAGAGVVDWLASHAAPVPPH